MTVDLTQPFLDAVCQRLKPESPRDCLILMVGGRREGKTWASIRLAELIGERIGLPYRYKDHNFNTIDAFLEAIDKNKLQKRQPVTIQELGVNAYRRNYMKEGNKSFNMVVQVMGTYRLCVICTLPSLTLLDKHQVLLAHYVLEGKGFNHTNNRSYFRPRMIAHDPISGDTYFPFFRYNQNKNQDIANILQEVCFTRPQQGEEAEAIDVAYKKELVKSTRLELRAKMDSLGEALMLAKKNEDKLVSTRAGKKVWSITKLKGFGFNFNMATQVKMAMEHPEAID